MRLPGVFINVHIWHISRLSSADKLEDVGVRLSQMADFFSIP